MISAILACPIVLVINLSGLPWTREDGLDKAFSMRRCAAKYEDAPCLIKYYKYSLRDSGSICGAKRIKR